MTPRAASVAVAAGVDEWRVALAALALWRRDIVIADCYCAPGDDSPCLACGAFMQGWYEARGAAWTCKAKPAGLWPLNFESGRSAALASASVPA